MALVTRPKPPAYHKKRQGLHHRRSKHYLRPYWPYLPMLIIIGGGIAVDRLWSGGVITAGDSRLAAGAAAAGQPLTRLQALTGTSANGGLDAVLIIAGLAFAVFVFRHWRRVRRWVNEGETFIYRHEWVDVTAVFVFTAGYVLTRTVGLG